MRKLIHQTFLCLLAVISVWCGSVFADSRTLQENVIRMHVVANSDTVRDQTVKLQIRDAVLACLESDLAKIRSPKEANLYLHENLPKIESIANDVLNAAGFEGFAVATLCKEAFPTRNYESFTLPAGVYNALRITIGTGEGKNWWCVVFPALCLQATSGEFEATAAGAGFSDTLNGALIGDEKYCLRFYCLDVLGRLENILFTE